MATSFRTLVNRLGISYDALKTRVFFAEDYNAHSTAINKIEDDLAYFPPLENKVVSISSSELLDLYDNPIVLIAGENTGKLVEVVSAVAYLVFNSVQYTHFFDLQIGYKNLISSPFYTCGDILGSVGDSYRKFIDYSITPPTMLLDNDIVLTTPSASPKDGDSDLKIFLIYRYINP